MAQPPKRRPQSARRANRIIQRRTLLLLLIFGLGAFVLLFGKLYHWQITEHNELESLAVQGLGGSVYTVLILYKPYSAEAYPKYDNYDAIEVGRTADIPCDYDDVMGVPISFMDKYIPEQFEILGATESEGKGFSNGLWNPDSKVAQPMVCGKKLYKRIFIRRKQETA